jgi:hypothetical protein
MLIFQHGCPKVKGPFGGVYVIWSLPVAGAMSRDSVGE